MKTQSVQRAEAYRAGARSWRRSVASGCGCALRRASGPSEKCEARGTRLDRHAWLGGRNPYCDGATARLITRRRSQVQDSSRGCLTFVCLNALFCQFHMSTAFY